MGKQWEVVGGADKGGIMVREGDGLKSKTLSQRLSTGATVEELEKKGDRIRYKLIDGTGPEEGWVAIKLPDKDLLVPKGAQNYEMKDGAPVRKLPDWKNVNFQPFEFGQMKERAAMKAPGDYFGIEFPHTEEGIMKEGPAWLTKAFQTSGVLTKDNKVTKVSMKNVTGAVSGGAGLKYTMKVEYARDEPYLHKDLFCKLPHDPAKGSDRFYVSVMWGHDRPESVFNIWLAPYVPFKVPKLYFCDISAVSTNFILITEQVKFAEKGTKDFKPGDIEPSYLKYADYDMASEPKTYYLASCRSLGKMAAYHKTGKLHPQINEMFPMPGPCGEIPKGFPGQDPGSKKMELAKVDQWIRFMNETAGHVFPKPISDKKWLDELKVQIEIIMDFQTEIHCYCAGAGTPNPNDYVCFTHNNLQVDNAIFYHNDDNELDVGMLDWGAMSCGPFIGAIIGGCTSGATVEDFCAHNDAMIQAAVDSYASNGGPTLDMERMKTARDLQVACWVSGLAKNTMAILKDVKAKVWPEIKELKDKRIKESWNAWAWCSQFNNACLIYEKMGTWKKFQDWQKAMGLPAKK